VPLLVLEELDEAGGYVNGRQAISTVAAMLL
jgi:hypothetical protein